MIAAVAARLTIPPEILLVLTGVVLALIPGLPPVVYSSAVAMSWREFRVNLRPISPLAVGSSCSRPSRRRHEFLRIEELCRRKGPPSAVIL